MIYGQGWFDKALGVYQKPVNGFGLAVMGLNPNS
jgi:hypothetical protein